MDPLKSERHCFGVVQVAAEEVRTDTSYFMDNQRRPDGSGLVVQLTLQGAAFYQNAQGRRQVGAEYAMLFSHDESSSYGFSDESNEPYRHRYIEFSDCPALRTSFEELINGFGPIVRIPQRSRARDIFSEIFERFRHGRFRDRYQQSELLYQLLIAIYREQVEGTRTNDPVEFGYRYIHNRFRDVCNLKEITRRCGITREHFTREFRRRYAEAPSEVLRRLRLEHADVLLRSTSLPVVEVALASGFANTNTFTRAYRRQHGMSPTEGRGVPRSHR